MLESSYYVFLTSIATFISFLFIVIEWCYFRRNGSSFAVFSYIYNIFALAFGCENVSIDEIEADDCNSADNSFSSVKNAALECKVWRNSLGLFRGSEYNRFQKVTSKSPLTSYDMNLSAHDYHIFFTCQNDIDSADFQVMQLAWREKDFFARIKLAYQALESNKYCVPALILLAEEQIDNIPRVEQVLKVALKVAENNYQRTAMVLNAAETHQGKNLTSSEPLYSHRNARGNGSQQSTNFLTSNSNSSFTFHEVDDELDKIVKELRKEFESVADKMNKSMDLKNVNPISKTHMHISKDTVNSYINQILEGMAQNTPETTHQRLIEELKRDSNLIVYIKRRLGMCFRRTGRLKEAAKMFKDLIKEFPLVNAFNIHENLIEVYLEMGAYADVQNVLTKYDDINLPKSAAICYTAALLKARTCADKLTNVTSFKLTDGFFYNYFEQINYFFPKALNTTANSHVIEAIYRAVEFNPHVPQYLLEIKPLIPPPEHVLRRGDSEAVAYAFFHLKHWKNVPGALKLLECTWQRTFRLIPNPHLKGYLFHPYQIHLECIDREILPSFHQVSIFCKTSNRLFLSFNYCIYLFIFCFILTSIAIQLYPDQLRYAIIAAVKLLLLTNSSLVTMTQIVFRIVDYIFPADLFNYLMYMLE